MKYFVAISLLTLLALLIQNKIQPGKIFLAIILSYYFLDFISLDKMLINFVNPSLVDLILLMIVSITLERTSCITSLSNKLFSKSLAVSVTKLSMFSALFSSFLNNTSVVALMISVIKKNKYHPVSKLLLPLSYATIFGGTMTLIGTSTNLIVNGLMLERGLNTLNLFDFIYIGLPITIICSSLLYWIAKSLPNNSSETNSTYQNYFIEAKIMPYSKLCGKSIRKNGLRNLKYLFLCEIIRNNQVILPVNPEEILQANDILLFSGDVKEISLLQQFHGLVVENLTHDLSANIIEVIVSNQSSLLGKKLKESHFRTKFNASVIAIKRGAEQLSGKIGEIIFQAGDSLILTIGKDFYQHNNLSSNFYIMNNFNIKSCFSTLKSLFAILGFLLVLLANALKFISLTKGLLILIGLFIIFKMLNFSEIKHRFPYELFIVIGSALGISAVIIDSGLATILAKLLQQIFSGFGIYGSLITIYLLTLILTELITNNATAVLVFPIAYSTALTLNVNPLPFIMAVAYGASASFMTSFGYQTNLMVASAGGYNFKTFLHNGFIISIVYSIIVLALLPVFFPF